MFGRFILLIVVNPHFPDGTSPRIVYLIRVQTTNNQFRGKDVGSVYFAIGLGIGAVAGLIINVLAT